MVSMSSHLLVGFVTLVVASAMMLSSPGQRSGHAVQSCEGADCNMEASGLNQSDSAHGGVVCQCCWRDCDVQSEDAEPLELAQKRARKELLAGANVDAWVIMSDHRLQKKLDWNIYTPVLEAVKVGVENKGAVAQIIGLDDIDAMLDGVKAAVAQGRRPLLLSIGHQFQANLDELHALLARFKQARDAGAYVISYQTEPLANWAKVTDQAEFAIAQANRMGAHELWEYTLAHTSSYPPAKSSLIIRFVPPGYVPKLDVGVDLKSHLMKATEMGYIGSSQKQMHPKYMEVLEGHLEASNSIYTPDRLRDFLEMYPVQLNQHRFQSYQPRNVEWEDEHQHFESLRMSILLANKACVISAPSSTGDMRVWSSVVHFAEIDETQSLMKKLLGNLNECRTRSYETYKRDFAPEKLMQSSGFFNAWKPPHGK